MQFATIDDLAAIGATKVDGEPSSPVVRRATRLLELASAQVASYAGWDDDTQFLALSEAKRDAVAAVVAEAASQRLSVSAAANVDQWPPSEGSWASAMLAPRHYRALDRILGRPGGGFVSIEVERDETSTYLSQLPPWSDGEWTVLS